MLLKFDDFVFDEAHYELRKGNTSLKIETKQLDLLAYFLRHPGVLVSKDELLDQIWEGRVMAESIMSVSVAKLRKTLGHKKGGIEYIENLYGRGYRFLRPVNIVESETTSSTQPPIPSRSFSAMPPFVGRTPVIQRLEALFEQAGTGKGRVCFLVGEPGIGKTRVAKALEERVIVSEALLAWAGCHTMEREPPLWLWAKILREYLTTPLAEEIQRILDERISELARFDHKSDLANEWAGDASAGHRVFDGIMQVLKKLSEQQTLVLVLDDLQWADAASLRLLSYLVVEIARWPALIIATLRSTEYDPQDKHFKHLNYVLGHANCERIHLNRLTCADVANYVTALFGEDDEKLSRAVYKKSEGIPFFMVELLPPRFDSRRPESDEIELSSLALDIMRQRIRKLNAESRNVLSMAAIIGRNFDLNMLSILMRCEESELLDLIDELLANDTIIPLTDDPGRFSFGHDLIREVLLQEVTATKRREWHLCLAEELEKRHAAGLEVATAELAHHFLSALPHRHLEKAGKYALNAAIEAASFSAFTDAYTLLYRALQALQTSNTSDPHFLCNLLLILSIVERALSDKLFLDHLNQSIKLAREHGFYDLLSVAGQQLSIGPLREALPEACQVLETAEKKLPESEKQIRAIVLSHLAWTPPHCMNTNRVNELIARAERLARESEDAFAITTVLRAKLFFNGDPTAQSQALSDELDQHIRAQPYFWILASIEMQHYRIVSGIQRGDGIAAQKAIDDFATTARDFKSVELEWHHQRMGVVQRMNSGDLVTTKAALFELREKSENLQVQALRRICDLDLSVLLSQTTKIPSVSADYGKKLEVKASDSQSIWAQKVRILVDFGLLGQAEDALKRFPVAMLYELPPDRNYLITLSHLAQGSVATGATEYVEALYSLLKPYTKYYVAGVSFHCEGSVSHYLGILARTLARKREAIEHLEEALQRNEQFGLEARVVRTRYELGRTLVLKPTKATLKQARSHITQALEDAQRLGLKCLVDDSKRLLTELF